MGLESKATDPGPSHFPDAMKYTVAVEVEFKMELFPSHNAQNASSISTLPPWELRKMAGFYLLKSFLVKKHCPLPHILEMKAILLSWEKRKTSLEYMIFLKFKSLFGAGKSRSWNPIAEYETNRKPSKKPLLHM